MNIHKSQLDVSEQRVFIGSLRNSNVATKKTDLVVNRTYVCLREHGKFPVVFRDSLSHKDLVRLDT
jgi:hypothetical protein